MMDNETHIVITGFRQKILTLVYENSRLAEIQTEPEQEEPCVGGIYIGKVRNIVRNINAAFIEIQPGVIGYYRLGTDAGARKLSGSPDRTRLVQGDEIAVQIEKEAQKGKECVLSSHFSLPGRFCVLVTDTDKNHISSKIKDKEVISRLAGMITPGSEDGVFWVFRTEAAQQSEDAIRAEMEDLLAVFRKINADSRTRTCFSCLYRGSTASLRILRRCTGQENTTVTTDLPDVYSKVTAQFPALPVRFYKDSYPLLKLYNIEAEIDRALARRVWLKSGADIIIDRTEAMTVIDVNTGKSIGKGSKRAHLLAINKEAAAEICRQLRLRSLSGIILIDFINMTAPEDRAELMAFLREQAGKDSTQTSVVDMTRLNLVEMTRRKVVKPLYEQLTR